MRWMSLIIMMWATAVQAAPERYALDPGASRVEFIFDLEGNALTGQVPVSRADVTVDFANLGQSRVDVTLSVAQASAGVIFATQAMKEDSVLAATRFPEARFVSTRVRSVGAGATLEGNLTLRGVTRPVRLDGQIFRRQGSDPGDLSNLVLLFTGQVNRSDFGATGYAHLVADQVNLRVLVAISRSP